MIGKSSIRTALLLAVFAWGGAAAVPPALQVLDKETASLDAYTGQGRWVIVKIWASDCGVCNAEAHQYRDFHDFNKDRGAVMLGLSLDGDDPAAARAFIERHELTYPNLLIERAGGERLFERLTGQRWIGTPSFLVYDPSGTLRAQQVGAVPAEMIEQFIAANTPAD